MLRVLIVDDEPLARRRLDILLRDIAEVEVVGQAAEAVSARRQIAELKPDVVLLDIKMPGMSGLELLGELAPPAPLVIFVTAFDRFAVQAFEGAAADYLLKPVEPARLAKAIERARETLAAQGASERVEELEEIVANLRSGPPAEDAGFERELWVQERGDRIAISIDAIDWIAAERDYVRLHVGAKSFLIRQSLGAMEARLDPRVFVRIHRSAIVRLDRIARVRRADARSTVVLANGMEIAVSRRQAARIRALTYSSGANSSAPYSSAGA